MNSEFGTVSKNLMRFMKWTITWYPSCQNFNNFSNQMSYTNPALILTQGYFPAAQFRYILHKYLMLLCWCKKCKDRWPYTISVMTRSGLLRERYHVTNHNVNHFYNGVSIAPHGDQDFLRRETACAFTLSLLWDPIFVCGTRWYF